MKIMKKCLCLGLALLFGGADLRAASTLYNYQVSLNFPGVMGALGILPTISASSLENSIYPASAAADGNLVTRWSSAFSDPQWLSVDLVNPKLVNQVALNWEAAYAKSYKIQSSLDGTLWTDLYTSTSGKGGQEIVKFSAANTRYVRMYGTQRATPYGY